MGLEPTLVCAISSPAGVGCGIIATLKGAPCILVPLHVVGGPENAQRVRIAAEVGGKITHLHRRPASAEGWRLSSPEPPRGRAPDVNRMDYVIAPCELPATIDARTLTALDACDPPSVVPRGEERTRRVEVVAAPASCPRPPLGSVGRTDERTILGRRSCIPRAPPTGTGASSGDTRARFESTSDVSRLTRRAIALHRWRCVAAARRRGRAARGGVRDERRRTSRRLVAMHRAGDPAASRDAEGLSIADIMRDVAEITAERAVQTGASAGNPPSPAASEDCFSESRAAVAVAPPPLRARRLNTHITRRGRRVIFPAAAVTFTRERTPCSPRRKNGKSFPRRGLFDSQTPPRIWLVHSRSSGARRTLRYEIDELLLDVLLKHDKVEAIVSKTLLGTETEDEASWRRPPCVGSADRADNVETERGSE